MGRNTATCKTIPTNTLKMMDPSSSKWPKLWQPDKWKFKISKIFSRVKSKPQEITNSYLLQVAISLFNSMMHAVQLFKNKKYYKPFVTLICWKIIRDMRNTLPNFRKNKSIELCQKYKSIWLCHRQSSWTALARI